MTENDGRRSAGRKVVLVVDDEAPARAAYVRVLERAQFETCEAESGVVALQKLRGRLVHAVILDQHMPGMTGMELTAEIRGLPAHDRTPILFVSGDRSPEIRVRALQAGATDFLVKPVVLAELVARVEVQLRVNATWQSTLSGLSRRAKTVAALAGLDVSGDPVQTATALCRGISHAEAGAPVGIYESRSDGAQILLASVGDQPSFVSAASDLRPSTWLREGALGVPWERQTAAEVRVVGSGMSWACAPLRRGSASLGLLVLGGRNPPGDSGAVDQLLAAAVEYAAVAALQLGLSLTDARSVQDRREAVRQTVANHEFWPVFQPVVNLRDGHHIGYEALTRFRDGIPLEQHLSEAAAVGLAEEMELAILTSAIELGADLPDDAWLSIDVSASTLMEKTPELVALLAKSSHRCVVELTEHDPIDDYPLARSTLASLGAEVRLAVDDAGAGFASLRHVVEMHPRYLKLDRSWVTGIEDDDARQAVVAGLVGFAARTGTDIIAEGIETEGEKAVLEELRVLYGQGLLLGGPQSPRAFGGF